LRESNLLKTMAIMPGTGLFFDSPAPSRTVNDKTSRWNFAFPQLFFEGKRFLPLRQITDCFCLPCLDPGYTFKRHSNDKKIKFLLKSTHYKKK
jgi:hypothetical protein